MPTPIQNMVPPSGEPIAVELTDGTKVSSERCVRWLDVKEQKWRYQAEIDGKQYLGFRTKGGKIQLL